MAPKRSPLTIRYGGRLVLIDPKSMELREFIDAADEACGASTTVPEVEALRRARKRLIDSLEVENDGA